jgi:invasion protein IalB
MKRFRKPPSLSRVATFVSAFSCIAIVAAWVSAKADTRVQKTFGDWTVTCVDSGGPKTCSLDTRAVTKADNIAFVWTISLVDKQVKSLLLVPAGISIPEGVRVLIGDGPPQTSAYSVCGPRWCTADLPLDAALLKKISGVQKATANFVTAAKKLVQVDLSLDQFPQAYQYFYDQTSK